MKEFETTWTKDELIAYILLYAAKADFIETQEEKEAIISKVPIEKYNSIHKEFDSDNDYISVQKIYTTMHQYNYSRNDIDAVLQEIKSLFLSDGSFDILEKNMLIGLKRLFSEE